MKQIHLTSSDTTHRGLKIDIDLVAIDFAILRHQALAFLTSSIPYSPWFTSPARLICIKNFLEVLENKIDPRCFRTMQCQNECCAEILQEHPPASHGPLLLQLEFEAPLQYTWYPWDPPVVVSALTDISPEPSRSSSYGPDRMTYKVLSDSYLSIELMPCARSGRDRLPSIDHQGSQSFTV